MTIWILALLLLGALGAVGFHQGAIRVAFSLVGLLLGTMLAGPLARLLKPIFPLVGLKNPLWAWLLSPFIIFLVVLIIFKIAGMVLHRKVDVHYKYKEGDLKGALWERLNHRVGLCLGLVNGAIYLLLISFVIHSFSYLTVQMVTTENPGPVQVRILNKAGKDLQTTGLAKAVAAIDPMPATYYDSADVVGVIYHNPLADRRLARYPVFVALGERPEFQEMAKDEKFANLRASSQVTVMELVNYPIMQSILNNLDLVQEIWSLAAPNLKDLRTYLETEKSPKFDNEKILGRWRFDLNDTLIHLKETKPNIGSGELLRQKKLMTAQLSQTSFLAAADKQAIFKGAVQPKPGVAVTGQSQSIQGTWEGGNTKYKLSFPGKGIPESLEAVVDGDKLTISGMGVALVFEREI
ncbi:MAG: CvpA family protein [Verrucomicrobia bacterium]|nr:CvpA family protein [Verrucomicrobiota bacterium]